MWLVMLRLAVFASLMQRERSKGVPLPQGDPVPLASPGVLGAALAVDLVLGACSECHSDLSRHKADGITLTSTLTLGFRLAQS